MDRSPVKGSSLHSENVVPNNTLLPGLATIAATAYSTTEINNSGKTLDLLDIAFTDLQSLRDSSIINLRASVPLPPNQKPSHAGKWHKHRGFVHADRGQPPDDLPRVRYRR